MKKEWVILILTYTFSIFIGTYIGIIIVEQHGNAFKFNVINTPISRIEPQKKTRTFNDNLIKQLFHKYIWQKMHNDEYLSQYEWISNATWLAPEFDPKYFIGKNKDNFKFDISRVIQTASFSKYVKEYQLTLPSKCANTLTFDVGVDPEVQYFNGFFSETHKIPKCENFTSLYYSNLHAKADRAKCDLYTLDLDFKQWDVILLPQFLEHFYNPQLIMDNLFHHLREGGYLYVSVPTINIPHMTPIHYQHFEPMGLLMLAVQSGFQIKTMDFWGHKQYIDALFTTHWWPPYTFYEDYEPLKNSPFHVSQTWGLFQKPIGAK